MKTYYNNHRQNCVAIGMRFFMAILLLPLLSQFLVAQVKIEPLLINSSDDDFGTSFAENGRVIFFSSARSGEQRVYVSAGYSKPEALSKELNNADQAGAISVTPDGQFMIFSAYEHSVTSNGRTDLYSARKVNGVWTDVKNLGENVNSSAWDSQPSLSADGMTLYFASDREGGFGGTDIYMTKRTGNSWSKPVNLGSTVNSESDEMSPSIAPDGTTFFFASDRSGSFGGFDIYTSSLKNGKFSPSRNLGSDVNSKADEYFYVALANSNVAYFSSNRVGGSGELDMYSITPNPVPSAPVRIISGVVSDAQTKAPLGAKITITDLKTRQVVGSLSSDDQSGQYYVVLTTGRDYSVTASKDGYLFFSERFSIPADEAGKEAKYDIGLSPVKDGTTRLLVFFDYNKSSLQDESLDELARTADFLKANTAIKISIEGHTDDQGDDAYNNKLSLERAGSVRDYLKKEGVEASRISVKGYGESKPVAPNTTEEGRAKNRHVEMRIIP